jgi:hypothetical protein
MGADCDVSRKLGCSFENSNGLDVQGEEGGRAKAEGQDSGAPGSEEQLTGNEVDVSCGPRA